MAFCHQSKGIYQMMRNNKGLSLIELIVAIAILAVAGVAILGFVMNTSSSYAKTNKEVKLQYEQQLAVNQVRDMIVESDKGIYFDSASKTLAFYGATKKVSGTTVYPVSVISFKDAEKKMYFGTKEFTSAADVTFASVVDLKLLSDNVKDFNIDLTQVSKDKVQFQITFVVGDKEQTVKETVALRNRLVVSNSVDTIWGNEVESVDSFITGIRIKRGTKTFSNGEQDIIGKWGETVSVNYTAEVLTNEESNREYAVKWSLEDAPEGVGLMQDGTITVAKTVPNTTFKLYATSLEDVTKSSYIEIKIEENGIYAKSVKLVCGQPIEGNGYRSYTLVPTLIYTNGSEVSEYSLFTWDINVTWTEEDRQEDEQTEQKVYSFDEETGILTLTTNSNGGVFSIKAKAVERNSEGNVIYSNEVKIVAEGIPAYALGPSVDIAVASTVPRGGYIFPTMVLKNTNNSSYTYDWKVTPYYDNESTEWDSDVANSMFNLISLSAEGGYKANQIKHEMQSIANKRTIALNCSERLNWSKTFKVVISGTATDEKGNVLTARPKIVTIHPVEITIAMTDDSVVGEQLYLYHGKPVLKGSVLRYEDWYLDGSELGTQAAKDCATRRWFSIYCSNLYLTGSYPFDTWSLGCSIKPKYSFRNIRGAELSNNNVSLPTSYTAETLMVCGFYKQMYDWEKLADRPVFMNYSIVVSDNYGNSKESNVESFTIQYDFYKPAQEQ